MKQPVKIAVVLLCLGTAIALYRAYTGSIVQSAAPPAKSIAKTKPEPSAASVLRVVPGTSVIDPDRGKWALRRQSPAQATLREIVASDLPTENKHAVRLVVTAIDPKKFWAAQILKRVPQEVEAGKPLTVRFWGRSPTNTPVWVMFEGGAPPHTPELQKKITLTPEWREYTLPFTTKQGHSEPHAEFCIKAGLEPGETEVAGIRVAE